MDSDKKAKSFEEDSDKTRLDTDKKTRRSSILKPQKPRNPFTTLDFSEPNPDTTLAKARRVSFASSNLVKPFAADPEKNTIWDTTYEEEINHTDSTKSSYEQTYETKSNDFLNVTSIYSFETENLEASIPKIWDRDITKVVTFDKENLEPNLKKQSFTETNRVLGLTVADPSKIMDLTVDKENVYIASNVIALPRSAPVLKKQPTDTLKHDHSLITPLNETITPMLGFNNTCMEESMEITNIINKENFNPIINDITLVTSISKSFKRNINMNPKKEVNNNPKNISIENGVNKKNHEVTSKRSFNYGEQTITNQSDMELTNTLLIMDIKENVNVIKQTSIENTNNTNGTIYFNEEDMEFTKRLDAKSKTILFDTPGSNLNFTEIKFDAASDMDFTCANTKNMRPNKVEIEMNISSILSHSKRNGMENILSRKTIYMDQSNCDMDFTSIAPVKTVSELSDFKSNANYTQHSPNSMELTLPTCTIKSNKSDMDFTCGNKENMSHSKGDCGKENILSRNTVYVDQSNSDMEFTSIIPVNSVKELNEFKSRANYTRNSPNSMELTLSTGTIKGNQPGIDFICANTKNMGPNEGETEMNVPSTLSHTKHNYEKENILSRKTIYKEQSNSDMEFTAIIPVNYVKELNDSKSKANYTQNSTNCMELTLPRGTIKSNKDDIGLSSVKTCIIKDQTCKNDRTIHFNPIEGDMELTSTIPNLYKITRSIPLKTNINLECENEIPLKNKTVYDDNMDITVASSLKMNPLNENYIQIDVTENKSKRKTIHFSEKDGDMDITLLPEMTVINESEVGNEADGKIKTVSRHKGDMELTSILPIKESTNLLDTNLERNLMEMPNNVGVKKSSNHSLLDVAISSTKDAEKMNNTAGVIPKQDTENNVRESTNKSNLATNQSEVKQESISNNSARAYYFNNQNKRSLISEQKMPPFKESMNASVTVPIRKVHENTSNLCQNTDKNNTFIKDGINITGFKRYSDSKNDREVTVKREKSTVNQSELQTSLSNLVISDKHIEMERNNAEKLILLDKMLLTSDHEQEGISNMQFSNKDQKVNLQSSTLSNSNILYSEPMKIKLKTHTLEPIPDLCDNLNLQSLNGSLNLKLGPTMTPSTSFHMTLTDMSPSVEDTQQLIYATFSKPECAQNKHSIDEKTFVKENLESRLDQRKTERSCYIEDESQVDLNACDDDLCIENSQKQNENLKLAAQNVNSSGHTDTPMNRSARISDPNNYTLRAERVLSDIRKYIEPYEILRNEDHSKLVGMMKESKKCCTLINELIDNFQICKIQLVDLEEKHKQDREESSGVNESASNCEDDKGVPSTAGLVAPKSLYERICEAAERCKGRWRLIKVENDEYCFLTLCGSLPFKVHVHPDLGVVYKVTSYTHLEVDARPICWYELKLLQEKLKEKNLLSVLGVKYDILTLLDYVYMRMEEIISFHLKYIELVKKYGVSQHFRMNRDLSISFEVINISLIIHWIITINMSPTSFISKESVNAVSMVGQEVREEDIKCIAENTPKGPTFFNDFIENVNDYVKRFDKKIKFRR